MDLSLVLACYNEGPTLRQSVEEILSFLELTRLSYELIFVDDASSDGTVSLIQEITRSNLKRAPIQTILHERNIGRGGAVRDGLGAAQGEVIGYIDVDLEVPPHYILPCAMAIRRGYDVAIGKRIYKFRWKSFARFLISKGYGWLAHRLLDLEGITDSETGYKFFRRTKALSLLKHCQAQGWFWDTEIMALCHMAGLSIKEVPCVMTRRFDKASTVKPLRDSVEYFIRLIQFRRGLRTLRDSLGTLR